MRQGLFPICIVCAVTATSSRKNFDKPSIATEKSFCNSKGVRIRSKQCFVVPFWNTEAVLQAMSLYIQRLLPCKSLLGAAQPVVLPRAMQASHFCKTLFQHTAGMRSHHGIVMITGIGIASQQAEHARQICNAVRVLAFVRTKALLADAN
jgi:hypothetical protein